MNEAARWGLRRRLLNVLDALRLARPAVQVYEQVLAATAKLRPGTTTAADGLPLPPASLRAQVGPLHADASFFLRSGEQHAELVRDVLGEQGTELEAVGSLLDWGCGCGRARTSTSPAVPSATRTPTASSSTPSPPTRRAP